jgi:hypothetical protein
MIYRELGRTGERVSAIGLGGYHIGKQQDPNESIRLIRAAYRGLSQTPGYSRTACGGPDCCQPSARICFASEWTAPQKSSGRFTTIGSGVLRTTTHWKGTSLEGLISWCGSHAGT